MIVDVFPVKLGKYEYPELVEETLEMNKKYLSNKDTYNYRWNYRNTYEHGYKSPENFGEDYDNLKLKIKDLANRYFNDRGLPSIDNMRITIFFSVMNEGEHHEKHNHSNSHLSGVFYLDTPEGSGDIVFYSDDQTETYSITPYSGLFLIWESWLMHQVLPSKTSGRRTAVFNIVMEDI